jgi:hypothetical protein
MVRIFDMSADQDADESGLTEYSLHDPFQVSEANDVHPQLAEQYCQLRLLSVAESEEQRVPRPRPWTLA